MSGATVRLTLDEALALCTGAAMRAGASADAAGSLARATVAAEAAGQATVGLSHFLDYLDALREGRIDGTAEPQLDWPTPIIVRSDARGGTAHLGFDRAFDGLVAAARQYGMATFAQRNAFTCGSLGWFAGRLGDAGLVAIAATNGPALMAGSGTTVPVFCTNPLAFAAPVEGGSPLLIDQASSATAFVNVRAAAERGKAIPTGWALGPEGEPTTDPAQALRGVLLPFGGAKGANVALMVEVMAAGLASANWAVDAPSILAGDRSPGSGLTIIALDPEAFDPGFASRLGAHLQRLAGEHGLHVPGLARDAARASAQKNEIDVPAQLVRRIEAVLPMPNAKSPA